MLNWRYLPCWRKTMLQRWGYMVASVSNNFLFIFLTIIIKTYLKVKRLYSRDWYLREHKKVFSTLCKRKNLLLRKSIMDYWKGMSPIVLISSIHWWNGISPVMLISFICMFISFILEKLNRWKCNSKWSNFSNLHRIETLPQREISNRLEFTSALV